jgi:transcription initiation factor TFIID subunit 7
MVVLKLNLASLPKQPASGHSESSRPTPSTSGVPSIPRIRVKSSASTKIRIKTHRESGVGYDSEASDKEEDPAIEEQIILRCKPGDDAEYLKECLERKEVPDMMIKFKGTQKRRVANDRSTKGSRTNTKELVFCEIGGLTYYY